MAAEHAGIAHVAIDERLNERWRQEAQVIRGGMRTLLLTGTVLVLVYALLGFLIFR